MPLNTSDKIAAFSALVSVLSVIVSTWAVFKVSTASEEAKEVELQERVDCLIGVRDGDFRTVAIRNRSTVHSISLPFVTMTSGRYSEGEPDIQYHNQSIPPNRELYLAMPDWTASPSSKDLEVIFQWLSPDLDRPRVHRCELDLIWNGREHRYVDASETDEWLSVISGDTLIPDDAVVVQPPATVAVDGDEQK